MSISWLWVAVAAQIIIGSSAVFDKLLLRRRSIEPWAYTFWLGIIGGFAVLLLPFGFEAAGLAVVTLALLSGILFIGSALAFFAALEATEVSEALPIVGAFIPIFTLGLAGVFLGGHLGGLDIAGFTFLVTSGFLLASTERASRRWQTVGLTLAASLLGAASTVAAKAVFTEANFITGFFWIKVGGFFAVLAFLLAPRLRRKIFTESEHVARRSRAFYLINRGYAGLGSLVVSFAISLGSPALVEATANFRYLVIFALGSLLLRERFRGWVLAAKMSAAALIVVGLSALALGEYSRTLPLVPQDRPIVWGVTYSAKFSRELGLDPRQNLQAVFEELRPETVRLVAYWSDIEKEPGNYDFSDLDWQFAQAEAHSTPIVLAIGLRVPRWPECHMPVWASGLPPDEREAALREHLTALVERYRSRSIIASWQVENEPYLWFGACPERPRGFLDDEIETVRAADPSRPIIVTDSGELGLWTKAVRHSDIFGTTMYRRIYPRFIGWLTGNIEYPLGPESFRIKERLVRRLTGAHTKPFIVSELQAEPWFPRSLRDVPYGDQAVEFSPEFFRDTIEYAKAADFDEYYLWGAEWWLWMGQQHGDWRYWETAKELFSTP